MKGLLFLILLLISATLCLAQYLPNYLTEYEKETQSRYSFPNPVEGITTPPPFSVRTMAEWEELRGIMITWAGHYSILSQIVDYAQEEGTVYIVTTNQTTVENYLTSQGVPLTNLEFIIDSFNSIWCRDYGPWTIYKDDIDSMQIIDWIYNRPRPLDDLIPESIADYLNLPIYSTTAAPYDLEHAGGNFFVDGHGTGFSSKLILNENPGKTGAEIDNIMNLFMGIDTYVKFNTLPYDVIHHIDMHMKLLDEETLLVGEYPPGIADGPQIEANLDYLLNNFNTCFGRDFEVVRIPMPPDASHLFPPSGDYRTYTNSIIVNKTVIVPTYELQYDTTALRIYREAMPGYNIVGINSNAIIPSLGAIHCITKEIGVSRPLFISHAKLRDTELNGPYDVEAEIKSVDGIASASLFWSADTNAGYQEVPMNWVNGDLYAAEIPDQDPMTEIFYYLSAETSAGKVSYKPLTATQGGYIKFIAEQIVPVELSEFIAQKNDSNIILSWNTASETNNKGFSVQKSYDKYTFTEIGFAEGNGTTTELHEYKFVDTNPIYGYNYYRLCQIDLDGSKTYSQILSIEILPENILLEQNYPNPFNAGTKIKYTLPSKGFVTLKVFDVLGREVRTLIDEYQLAGSNILYWDGKNNEGNDLGSGLYLYSLRSGDKKITKKMLLIQ